MLGQITRVEYPDAAETTYGYNSLGQRIRQTDPDGVQILYAYSDSGEQIVQAVDINRNGLIDYAGTDRIERVTTEIVDISGTVFAKKTVEHWDDDANGTPTIYLVTEQSTDGLQRSQTANGLTVQTVLSYDGSGDRTETIRKADGTSILKTFDQGRLASSTVRDTSDQTIRSTTYAYGPHGRLLSETLAGIGTTSYTYNVDDQVASMTTPDPDTNLAGEGLDALTTQYEYDDRGRLIKITHPDGAETHSSYYPTGKIKRTWGARTYPVEYAYDPQQRITSMKTWKDFDSEGGGATTQWTYHPQRGWLSGKIHADDNGPSYTYTPAGRLETRTWARSITTTYGYEDGGELNSITYSDATPSVTYTHNRSGAVDTISDAAGLLTLTRTNGHVLGEAYSGSGILSGKSLSRGVDAFNRVNSLGATSVSSVSLAYDDASRLATATQGSRVATYTHGDALETIDQVRIETSGTERYRLSRTHDKLGRVTRIDTLGNETTFHARHDYLHNNANQRTEVIEGSGRKWSFDYDSLGQVIKAEKLESAGEEVLPGYAFAYTFDDIGNRISTTVNERMASYSSDALNQYTQRDYPGAVDVRGLRDPGTASVLERGGRAQAPGHILAAGGGDSHACSRAGPGASRPRAHRARWFGRKELRQGPRLHQRDERSGRGPGARSGARAQARGRRNAGVDALCRATCGRAGRGDGHVASVHECRRRAPAGGDDRARQVSRFQAPGRGRGQGAQGGKQGTAVGRRCHAQRGEIRVSAKPRKHEASAAGTLRVAAREPVEDGAGVGDQRAVQAVLELRFWGGRKGVFPGLVRLGKPLTPEADPGEGEDAQEAPGGPARLHHPPGDQRRDRGAQLKDPDDKERGAGLPLLQKLPNRHPVPLRKTEHAPGTQPASTKILEERKSLE